MGRGTGHATQGRARQRIAPIRRAEAKRRKLRDDYYAARTADFAQIEGAAAFRRQLGRHGAAHARQCRRLAGGRAQGRNGWRCTAIRTSRIFYSSYGEALQKRFFGHFLKGEDTGWG